MRNLKQNSKQTCKFGKNNISKQELLIVSDKSFFIMSIKLSRKYDFFWQKNNCDYNYHNEGFITISITTMDFTKLQEAATISKEALAKKTTETQKALEQSFVDAMKSWEDAVKAKEAEANKDTTKSSEALQVRSNFDTFKNNLETEVRNLLNQEQAEKKEVEQQTKTETEKLLDSITQDSIAILSAAKDLYKGKTRADMVRMENLPAYINAFQTIIIQLGASIWLDDKSMDRIWPITRAGVKTIQKYLNDTYQAGLDIDGVPGSKTLEQLLTPVSSTDTTTRLDKMLSEKPTLTLFAVEISSTIKTNKKTDTSWIKKEEEVVTIKWANEEIPEKVIDAKLKELKKLYPKLDDAFLKAWAKAIISLKASTTLWEFIYDNKTYYFDSDRSVSRTKSKIDKKIEVKKENITKSIKSIDNKENKTNKEQIDNSLLNVIRNNIKKNLSTYISENPIIFNDKKYQEYYEKNLKWKIIDCPNNEYISWIVLQIWSQNISLQTNDFLRKDNSINYETIKKVITNKIIENADRQENIESDTILSEKYKILKDYLEWTYFSRKTIYPDNIFNALPEWNRNLIEAFFLDFEDKLEFNRWDSILDKKNKKITFEFEEGSESKHWRWKMTIDDKVTKDYKLNTSKVKENIRGIINQKLLKKDINSTISNQKKEVKSEKKVDTSWNTTTSSSTWNNYNK